MPRILMEQRPNKHWGEKIQDLCFHVCVCLWSQPISEIPNKFNVQNVLQLSKVFTSLEINALAQSSKRTVQWIFNNCIPFEVIYLWFICREQRKLEQLKDKVHEDTLICHACKWVYWIYGHNTIRCAICYVPCAILTHLFNGHYCTFRLNV